MNLAPCDFSKCSRLQLNEYDASLLTESKEIALFYEAVIEHTQNYKAAANFIMGAVKSYLNEKAFHIKDFPISASRIAELINLVDEGKISNSVASKDLFQALLEDPESLALAKAQALNLIQESNEDELQALVEKALASNPAKVEEYRAGKKGLLGMFMGQVMKLSGGKADPKLANQLVRKALENE
jgi:aspartyl-tRNA(Asn)/glutamyl-tRNA(Gln) amidotransferase subunit B